MTLRPTLESIGDLYKKLERELYRTFHANDEVHMADHFYNFCVTAHSMRDYFFEIKELMNDRDRGPYYDSWSEDPLLVAVSEIANTYKHFELRKGGKIGSVKVPKTQDFCHKNIQGVNVIEHTDGSLSAELTDLPSYLVRLETGAGYDVRSFTKDVIKYWGEFLKNEGISVEGQSFEDLVGDRT